MTHPKGFETDMDNQRSDEDENDSFEETIAPEKENRVRKEFEIGQLGNEQLQEDESTRDETSAAPGNSKPSQKNFNAFRSTPVKTVIKRFLQAFFNP